MLVKFNANLGSLDALECSKATRTTVDHNACTLGAKVDLSDEAVQWFRKQRASRFRNLFEPVEIRGVAKKPEVADAK